MRSPNIGHGDDNIELDYDIDIAQELPTQRDPEEEGTNRSPAIEENTLQKAKLVGDKQSSKESLPGKKKKQPKPTKSEVSGNWIC